MGFLSADGCDLYYEEAGEGVPILLIHPAGASASTWGSSAEGLARIGRVISYDRRGNGRSAGEPVHLISRHTADAAALLDFLQAAAAVVVGMSIGATIAIDLALRRADLVQAVVAHESPWRAMRHRPTGAQLAALAKMAALTARRRHGDAAQAFLRFAYSYRNGGTAWDAFPEEWRQTARENAKAALADIRIAIGSYPSAKELTTLTVPVVCSYGSRSPDSMARITRTLASAIPTATTQLIEDAGHAAPFDAPANFAQLVADAIRPSANDTTPNKNK